MNNFGNVTVTNTIGTSINCIFLQNVGFTTVTMNLLFLLQLGYLYLYVILLFNIKAKIFLFIYMRNNRIIF